MRIPHVHKYHLENVEKTPSKEIEVDIRPEAYLDDIEIFEDKKEYIKFMIRLKKMIRDSLEYKDLIYFLKRRRKMECCGVHPNLTVWNGFRIELHHTPFVLEDICDIVIRKRIKRKESLKMTDICREVMELHYLGLVGLYPLCQICHAYAHPQGSHDGDDLFIPIDNVFGDPEKFWDIYGQYATESMQTKYHNIQELNKGYSIIQATIPESLMRQYIYIKPKDQDGRKSELEVISTSKLVDFINEINRAY